MTNRRDFLKLVGATSGGMLFLPQFLTAMSRESLMAQAQINGNILVVIQLNGGNDGLNTFIPYTDPMYYTLRKTIGMPKDKVLNAANGMGFHPAMQGFNDILQDGALSVVQNVGYPNPNRSHFRSIEIWQNGSASDEFKSRGWLGRYLDAHCKPEDNLAGLNLDVLDSPALRSFNPHSLTIQDPVRFEKQLKQLGQDSVVTHGEESQLSFVRKLMVNSFSGSENIQKAIDKSKIQTATYPKHKLAQDLQWIARMIKGDLPTSVYYTGQGGFDTHANQLGKQPQLLKELSESVKAFYDDLKNSGLINRTTILVFSEFGRRAAENGSGTDHGTAAPVFVLGGGLKSQIVGSNPDLNNLDSNGDLKHQIDFRSIYASILQNRFNFDPLKADIKIPAHKGLFV